ncbi:MAG: lanthionine synthetase LanC family protein [Candidatus Aminicenantes bacterium]
MKKRLLDEARRIGDRLLAEAETDENGMHWKTMTMDLNRNISFIKSESIYSGVSGIVLFFLELFKQTQDKRYLDAATAGMKWVINYCKKNPSNYYAFFTGRMGVSYTLLQMHQFTREKDYLENAMAIARPCKDALEDFTGVDDLINGTSGSLLGLLHLHAVSREEWIPESIDCYIRHLVHRANHGPVGLYWDRSPQQISGLCGFSHGAAGIGFVFLELGRYFQNKAFYFITRQAFLYENYFFNQAKKHKNWPDLRKGIYSDDDYQEHQKAFLEGDMDFFTRGSNMNAWCHGAAGIGLSRLRAWQLLKNPAYKNDVQIAVEKTILTDIESSNPGPLFILCHGSGGNAELFIYAYQILRDKKYLSLAEKIALNALAFHKKHNHYQPGYRPPGAKEDRSLFMGNAGVGYFLLRLVDPFHVPSILAPTIDVTLDAGDLASAPHYPFIDISLPDLQKRLLQKNFKRSILVSEKVIPGKLKAFFTDHQLDSDDIGFSLVKSFADFIKKTMPTLPAKKRDVLSEVFELEKGKRQMDESIKSHCLLNIKEKVLAQQAEKIIETDNEAFKKLIFRLGEDVRLAATDWDWNESNREQWLSNLDREKGQEGEDFQPILLKPTPVGIIETRLSPFSYTILYEFQESKPVEEVIPAVLAAFESLTPEQEEMLKEKIIQQIKEALLAGILIQV